MSLLVVGFSNSFWMALVGRSIGGLLNGNQGVIQTMVSELVTNPEHEPRAYAIMPFVWSVGSILGPVIGGCLYNCYATSDFWSRYPALMPNLVCASILSLAVITGAFCLEETHPEIGGYSSVDKDEISEYYSDHRPLLTNIGATDQAPADITRNQYSTFNTVEVGQVERSADITQKAFNQRVVMLVLALGIFTFSSMMFDNLIPVFFQDRRGDPDLAISSTSSEAMAGGLGMSTSDVGVIMMVQGIFALLIQAFIFPLAVQHLGLWKSFVLVTFGHPVAYALVPLLAFIPASSTGLLNLGIYSCLTIRNIFGILAYPLVLILLKEASPAPAYLGRINGLAASVGAASRTIASPVAGALYTAGVQAEFTALPWLVTAAVALIGVIQVFFIGRQEDEPEIHVESAAAQLSHEVARRASVVYSHAA